ncbi:MAG: DnaB-like helicase C-terminal domain-containing protein, partial [Sulfurimonas sp.]
MADLFNLELEKYSIAALIKYPALFDRVELFIKTKDFHYESNQRIFEVIRGLILQNKTPDAVLIAAKISDLGITLPNGIQAFPFLKSLELVPINEQNGLEYFQELATLSARRRILDNLRDCAKFIKTTDDSKIDNIISGVDGIYNTHINSFDILDQPVSLFGMAREVIQEKMNNPGESTGYMTGFKEFDELYGGLRPKNLYCIASRAGGGKTSFLVKIAHNTANIINKDKNIKVLYLDSEMEFEDQICRTIAAITGIPFSYIDDGTIAQNPEWKNKLNETLDVAEKEYNFDFLKVGNKSTEAVISIIRRWYNSKVGRGNPAICVFDYLKLTSETVDDSNKEYAIIGRKTDLFKKLAEELNIVFLTAVQMNREGENQGKKMGTFANNSTTIAQSDRISWFCSFLALFQRKTLDQI